MINPVSFKVPSLKAGCGGIDIFGGSFSWPNSEEFTRTLRAIGQNAIGYAFSLGLEWVCPTCSAVLGKIQHMMNQITSMSTDSCTAAKSLVNGTGDMLGLWELKNCETNNMSSGDSVSGWLQCAGASESDVRKQIREDSWTNYLPASSPYHPNSGQGGASIVAEATKGQNLSDDDRIMIISYIGNSVRVGGKDDETENLECKYEPPSLTFKDLIDGGQVKLHKCVDGEVDRCNKWGTETKTIEGYREKVNKVFSAIYTKMSSTDATSRTLTDEQKAFIERISTPPVYKLIDTTIKLQDPSAAAASDRLLAMYGEIMALEYAWGTVDMYLQVFYGGVHNIKTVCAGETEAGIYFRERLKSINQEKAIEVQKAYERIKSQVEAAQFIASLESELNKKASNKLIGLFLK